MPPVRVAVRTLALAIAGALVLQLTVTSLVYLPSGPSSDLLRNSGARNAEGAEALIASGGKRFRMNLRAGGLYPGARKWMKLKVNNPYPFPIKVTRIRVARTAPSAECPATSVKVRIKKKPLKVRALGRKLAKRHVRVRMVGDVAQACQGARFNLRLKGRAVRGR